MVKCINQLVRSKEKIPAYIRGNRIGDCTICKPCKDNKKCPAYTPIGLIEIEEKYMEDKTN